VKYFRLEKLKREGELLFGEVDVVVRDDIVLVIREDVVVASVESAVVIVVISEEGGVATA